MAPGRSSIVEPCKALRPLFVSMRILGFVFSQQSSQVTPVQTPQGQDVGGKNEQPWATAYRGRNLANRIYCLSVCCLLWCRALSFLPSFWVGMDFNPGISMKACFLVWFLQCSLNASVSLYESMKGNAFSSFYQVWKSLQMKETCERSTEEEEEGDSVSEETMSCAHIALSYCDAEPNGNPTAVTDKTEYCHSHSHCRDRSFGKTVSRKKNVNDTYPNCDDNTAQSSAETHQKTDEGSKHHEDANNDDDKGHKTDKDGDKDHKNGHKDPKGESFSEDDGKDADSHSKNQLTSGGKSTLIQTERESKRSLNKYERIGILYTVIAWVAVVFSDVVSTLFAFDTIPQAHAEMMRTMTAPFGTALPVKIAIVAVHFVATSAWILPPVVCYSLCVLLWTRFSFLTASITTTLSQTEDRFPSMLERWRQEHLRLSQCVVTLNGYVGKMLMVSYATNLPLTVLLLYQMTVGRVDGELGSTLINVYWFLIALLNITLVSVFAAFVHEAAHSPLERLFFVRADQASPIQLAQLQLFLSKLSATSIGFDVLGITITKEIILTLYGLLFTYFVVLIPYQL